MYSTSNMAFLLQSLLFASLSIFHSTNPAKASEANIVVSIYPLYLAVQEAFSNQVNVEVLLPARVSPHHYALKPSEMKRLKTADLFVWVGPELENFLVKPVQQQLSADRSVFSVLDWLQTNKPDGLLRVNQSRSESHSRFADSPRTANAQNKTLTDPHIWLSQELVISAIFGIQQRLAIIYPDKASSLQQSAEIFAERLRQQPSHSPLRDKKFISYHNGFDYLAKDAGFSIIDVMTTNTDLRPGAKPLVSIRNRVEQDSICLITEPQFSSGVVTKLVENGSIEVIEVDPTGGDYTRYSEFLSNTLAKLGRCGTSQAH